MTPRKRNHPAPAEGDGSFAVDDLGEPRYHTPVDPARGVVRLITADAVAVTDAGEPRLSGMAKAQHAEFDRPLIPTREELCALPRWARVAYLARCMRRILPAYHYFWPDAPTEHTGAIARAVEATESAGQRGQSDHILEHVIEAANRAETFAYHRMYSRWVAAAAANAADAAAAAASGDDDPKRWEGPLADSEAANLLFRTATRRTLRLIACIRRDFDRLVRLAREQTWTDDTPVPPEVFGPLWPKGLAPDWAKETP